MKNKDRVTYLENFSNLKEKNDSFSSFQQNGFDIFEIKDGK